VTDLGKVTRIDELIAAPKKLAGKSFTWKRQLESDQKLVLKSPIEVAGEMLGKFVFICNATQFCNEIEIAFILSYAAIFIEEPIKTFSDMLHYFFKQANIELIELPEPIFEQMNLLL
jgi:hypothetical protein